MYCTYLSFYKNFRFFKSVYNFVIQIVKSDISDVDKVHERLTQEKTATNLCLAKITYTLLGYISCLYSIVYLVNIWLKEIKNKKKK